MNKIKKWNQFINETEKDWTSMSKEEKMREYEKIETEKYSKLSVQELKKMIETEKKEIEKLRGYASSVGYAAGSNALDSIDQKEELILKLQNYINER